MQVELTTPPGFEIVRFSGEEFGEDPEEIEPQHLAPNDSMVFYQHLETCAPDLVDEQAEFTVTVTFQDATTFEEREVVETFNFFDLAAQPTNLLPKGAAVLAYAEGLKAFKKAGPDPDKAMHLDEAVARIGHALAIDPDDPELQEIQAVLSALSD